MSDANGLRLSACKHFSTRLLLALILMSPATALADGSLTTHDQSFDMIAKINALGGTVAQIGGGDPGKMLSVAADFVPPVNTSTGVSVSIPG